MRDSVLTLAALNEQELASSELIFAFKLAFSRDCEDDIRPFDIGHIVLLLCRKYERYMDIIDNVIADKLSLTFS